MDTSARRFPTLLAALLAVLVPLVAAAGAIAFQQSPAPGQELTARIAQSSAPSASISAAPSASVPRVLRLHESSLCPTHWNIRNAADKPTALPLRVPFASVTALSCWQVEGSDGSKPMKRPDADRSVGWGRWIQEAESIRACVSFQFHRETALLAYCRELERVGHCAEQHPILGDTDYLRCLDDALGHIVVKNVAPTAAESTRIAEAMSQAQNRSLACLRDKDSIDTKALNACIVKLYEQNYPRDL